MTAQAGKDVLLKIGDGGSPESFTTLAGLRAKTLSLNARAVEVTAVLAALQVRQQRAHREPGIADHGVEIARQVSFVVTGDRV